MLKKEIKYRIFSWIFPVILLCVFCMVYDSVWPYSWYFYAEPLTRQEFSYINLRDDYLRGKITVLDNNAHFEKNIILDADKKKQILGILSEMEPDAGLSEKISSLNINLDEKTFQELMEQVGKIAGSMTFYNTYLDFLYEDYVLKRVCYFEFNDEYNDISIDKVMDKEKLLFDETLQHEKFTEMYARYLCDYLGVLACILPVLYGAFIFVKDKKSQTDNFIYTSSIESGKIILNRIISIVLVFAFIFYLIALIATLYFVHINQYYGYSMDYTAFFRYVTAWVIPTVIVITALSVLLGIIIKNGIVVFFIHFVLFLLSASSFSNTLRSPIIRSNTLNNYRQYTLEGKIILSNRLIILSVSAVLIYTAFALYENGRCGKSIKGFIRKKTAGLKSALPEKQYSTPFKNRSILYYQLKQVCSYNILFGIFFIIITAFLFLQQETNKENLLYISETFLIFSSIFIYAPICNIERNYNMYEMVSVKSVSYCRFYIYRFIPAFFLTCVLTGIPLLLAAYFYHIKPGIWCIGICLSSLFLGNFVLLCGEITKNRLAAILAGFGYIVICNYLRGDMKILSVCGYKYNIKYSKYSLIAGIVIEMLLLIATLYSQQNEE